MSKLVAPPPRGKKKPKRTRKVAPPKASGETPLFAPDAASLRTLLAEQPEALETGLRMLRGDDGTAIGAGYASDVGDIDLRIARTAAISLQTSSIPGTQCGRGDSLVPHGSSRASTRDS